MLVMSRVRTRSATNWLMMTRVIETREKTSVAPRDEDYDGNNKVNN